MWNSYRKLLVDLVINESDSAKSFYLTSSDGEPLMEFRPGQHLPLRLTIDGSYVHRCYTLSDCFNQRYYRLTIKREPSPGGCLWLPAGLSSNYFHDHIHAGSIIEAKAPSGSFVLDLQKTHPVVMLAGGIGITPIMSMINASAKVDLKRDIYLFFALRNRGEHVFKERLHELAVNSSQLNLHVLYEQIHVSDNVGKDYHHAGRINVDLLKNTLPTLDMEYYMCGPGGMMKALSSALSLEGIEKAKIKTESFGPSGLESDSVKSINRDFTELDANKFFVNFAKTGKIVKWDPSANSLLEFSLASGVHISSGCLYGDCGTCMTTLLDGSIVYNHVTGITPDMGSCLPCSCKPNSSIILDA